MNQIRQHQNVNDLAPFVRFEYQSPYPTFNRDEVFGRLATLFTISEPKKYCPALQEVAGGKIRNVVCANERLASEILKAKVLRERVTFMPLNRIQFRKVDRKIVEEISKLTDGSAKLALDLIEYEPKYEAVMQQVFGSIFICDDQDSAKKICYN